MPGLSRRLKQLDEELLALGEETMLLEELDGFLPRPDQAWRVASNRKHARKAAATLLSSADRSFDHAARAAAG